MGEIFNYALNLGVLSSCFYWVTPTLKVKLMDRIELWDGLSLDPGTISVSWALNPI